MLKNTLITTFITTYEIKKWPNITFFAIFEGSKVIIIYMCAKNALLNTHWSLTFNIYHANNGVHQHCPILTHTWEKKQKTLYWKMLILCWMVKIFVMIIHTSLNKKTETCDIFVLSFYIENIALHNVFNAIYWTTLMYVMRKLCFWFCNSITYVTSSRKSRDRTF